jgi:hypothetical protein
MSGTKFVNIPKPQMAQTGSSLEMSTMTNEGLGTNEVSIFVVNLQITRVALFTAWKSSYMR